jgi:hypothetical protein
MKSRGQRWAKHVAHMRESFIQGFSWKNLTEGNNFEDSGADGRIILKRIFER